MSNFYVYGYFDPRTDVCFYIGKGQRDRAWVHLRILKKKPDTHFYRRLSKMMREGVIPKVILLSVGLTEKQAFTQEQQLIASFGRLDIGTGTLCNQTDGGDGVSGHVGSEKQKEAARLTNAGKAIPIEAYYPDTGEVYRRFESRAAAIRSGFDRGSISACIAGKTKTHRGYAWRFAL